MATTTTTSTMRTIDVYTSTSTIYLIGTCEHDFSAFKLIVFDRNAQARRRREALPLRDVMFADPRVFTRKEIARLLRGGGSARKSVEQWRREAFSAVSAARTSDTSSLPTSSSSAPEASPNPLSTDVPVRWGRVSCLLGVIRFVKGYYLVLVTEKRRLGYINGHVVYAPSTVHLLSVSNLQQSSHPPSSSLNVTTASSADSSSSLSATTTTTRNNINNNNTSWWLFKRAVRDPDEDAEARYLSLFQLIDLTKGDFFWSYSYDLSNTLQVNCLGPRDATSQDGNENNNNTRFVWNTFLMKSFLDVVQSDHAMGAVRGGGDGGKSAWFVPLIHGSFHQQRCESFGRVVTVTLIGRRSRFFAGTRYLKRGVNDAGDVANEVEVEQIVEAEGSALSGYVQLRGSIPTFWTQETSAAIIKPPIKRYRYDASFRAARLHFDDLLARYGAPVAVLNLVRQSERRPRESQIGEEFAEAVATLNLTLPPPERVVYKALDFKRMSKHGDGSLVLRRLSEFAGDCLERGGVFAVSRARGVISVQRGAVRTNCIDGLDRTNVGQFMTGLRALAEQLRRVDVLSGGGSQETMTPPPPLPDDAAALLTELYQDLGDRIAQQYGGSQAHKKGTLASSAATSGTLELLTTMRRYYSNSFTDRAKQDAINLFLGAFEPCEFHAKYGGGGESAIPPLAASGASFSSSSSSSTPSSQTAEPETLDIWDLETDFYLHNDTITRNTFSLDVEPGTMHRDIWSHLKSEGEHAGATRPLAPAIKSPLTDEEDAGVFVSFDRVFSDEFFRPRPVTLASQVVASGSRPRRAKGVHHAAATTPRPRGITEDEEEEEEDDDDDEDDETVVEGGEEPQERELDERVVASTRRNPAPTKITSPRHVSSNNGVMSTDSLLGELFHPSGKTLPDSEVFLTHADVSRTPSALFDARTFPPDPAFEEHISLFSADGASSHEMHALHARLGFLEERATGDASTGELAGATLSRGTVLTSLISHDPLSPSIYSPVVGADMRSVETRAKTQEQLFAEYVRGRYDL